MQPTPTLTKRIGSAGNSTAKPSAGQQPDGADPETPVIGLEYVVRRLHLRAGGSRPGQVCSNGVPARAALHGLGSQALTDPGTWHIISSMEKAVVMASL